LHDVVKSLEQKLVKRREIDSMDPFHNFMRACAYLFPSGKSDTRNVNKRFLQKNSTFH